MNIAEVANIREAVPPLQYGGTEYVISAVTEGLANKHHTMSLFATGDSKTKAHLEYVCEKSIGFGAIPEPEADVLLEKHMRLFASKANSFDLVHNHILETFTYSSSILPPIVTTLHTDLSRPNEQNVLQTPEAQKEFFISISDNQRKPLPNLPYIRTIYHGIPVQEYPFKEQAGEYFLFLGRITPEKGVEVAVEAAKQAGRKLIVAAKVDEPLTDYAKQMLQLFKDTPCVDFIGQIGGQEKKELLSNAYALLMPIQWEEPFGLVVIEAMACGTPVIAFRRGSMPEIIKENISGFLVDTVKEMAEASGRIKDIKRINCRQQVEQRFSFERMIDDYEKVFIDILSQKNPLKP